MARYAESTGKERNYAFPEAWRYRDWVIAALNADKPYDVFLREQIAGDLMPFATPQQRDAQVIATGFLAIGPKSLNERNKAQFTADLIDEQIDVVTRATMATTVACARCHDHKYDPIAQRDYYAVAGIFKSTKTYFGTESSNRNRNSSELIPLLASLPQSESQEETSSEDTALTSTALSPAQRTRLFEFAEKKNPKLLARLRAMSPVELVHAFEKARDKFATKGKRGAAAPAKAQGPACMGVQDGKAGDARLLIRGEIDQPGETVPRGLVPILTAGSPPSIPTHASGRLQLAEWITSPSNPLTARVMVNRAWQQLFGEGLVATEDNFGLTGERPSNPSLLDALAVKFQTPQAQGGMGWSVKALLRELVTSRAYQLSSTSQRQSAERDPDNRLTWCQTPRRLDAESIRDAILAASGALDVTPPGSSPVAKVREGEVGRNRTGTQFAAYQSRNRSVYLPIVRDFVPEMLDVFDFAEPSLVIAAREVTNVPAQALFLMNDEFVRNQSTTMAARILAMPLDFPQRIHRAHELVLGRPASESEYHRAHSYLLDQARAEMQTSGATRESASLAAWATFCQALFATAEFRYLR